MNWTFILIGFAISVLMGSAMVSLLATVRPHWSAGRRRLVASTALPVITVIATLLGMLFVATSDHGQSERMEDLALAALGTIGGGLALLAWVGGLVGATLATLRRGG